MAKKIDIWNLMLFCFLFILLLLIMAFTNFFSFIRNFTILNFQNYPSIIALLLVVLIYIIILMIIYPLSLKLFSWKKESKEKRNFKIKIYFDDNGSPLTITKQISKNEAREIYNNLIQLYKDKEKYLEIEQSEKTYFILKKHITLISLKPY